MVWHWLLITNYTIFFKIVEFWTVIIYNKFYDSIISKASDDFYPKYFQVSGPWRDLRICQPGCTRLSGQINSHQGRRNRELLCFFSRIFTLSRNSIWKVIQKSHSISISLKHSWQNSTKCWKIRHYWGAIHEW